MPAPKLREKTALIDETAEYMGQKEIKLGLLEFPKMMPPGNAGTERVRIKANLFPIKLSKNIKVYQLQVNRAEMGFGVIQGREAREPLDLVAVIKSSFTFDQRTALCRAMFDLAVHCEKSQPISRNRVYYDGTNIVYSLDPLSKPTVELVAHRSQDQEAFKAANPGAESVVFVLESTEKVVSLGDIPNVYQALADSPVDFRPLQQFIETATSEHALQSGRYFVTRGGTCYDLKENDQKLDHESDKLPHGAFFAGGAKKTARMIQGGGSIQTSLSIKPVVTPFHLVENLAEKILKGHPKFATYSNGQLANVDLMLKGLFILPLHRPHISGPKEITGLDSESSRTRMIDYNDGRPSESVFAYFLRCYNFEIEHPDLPLVVIKKKYKSTKKNTEYLPMSVCEVADNQPIKGRYAESMVSQVLGVNCLLPRVFEEKVLKCLRTFGFDSSPCLQEAGITIGNELTQVEARVLPVPEMVFGGEKLAQVKEGSNWRPGNYFFGSSNIERWCLWVLQRPDTRQLTVQELDAFARKFVAESRKRGIQIVEPIDNHILDIPFNGGSEFDEMKKYFGHAQEANVQFIMVLTDFEDKMVHPMLKKLELDTQIVTQNVTLKTVAKFIDVGGNLETVNNVIQKTNEKTGGSNYVLNDTVEKKYVGHGDLFVGIATNQLTTEVRTDDGTAPPSIIGYSANDQKCVSKFTGDYLFAQPFRSELFMSITHILETVLNRYKKNRGTHPERVFLYLNGVTEGNYADLLKYVVPIARAAVLSTGCSAPITIINGTKLHNVRIIPSSIPTAATKSHQQNVKPGTVVDTSIVSPLYNEFYLISHTSSLGTARPPRFSVICNDGNLSNDTIQRITFYLSFAFQIINRPVSLPAPIAIALEMAKRGRMNLNSATQLSEVVRGSTSTREAQERLTLHLSYGNKELRETRFNA